MYSSEDIKDYFAKYGNVLEVNLKTDPSTGRSRGFAFVLFDSSSSVDKVRCNFTWKTVLLVFWRTLSVILSIIIVIIFFIKRT